MTKFDCERIILSIVREHIYNGTNVSLDSQIYYELKIYGEELCEMIGKTERHFLIYLYELNLNDFGPGDSGINFHLIFKLLNAFKKYSVKDLVSIVCNKVGMED